MSLKTTLAAAVAALTLGLGTVSIAGAATAGTIVKPGTTSTSVAYPPICRWDPLFPRYCRRW